ncbi:MAG: NAD(P)-dependent oxidoreductase [Chitinophagaceae bacterium]|nr:NAD(P)-dependent oxidoreductase [Chitinophagaceae bacterium]
MIGITGSNGVLGTILRGKLDYLGIKYVTFNGDIRNESDMYNWIKDSCIDKLIYLAAIVPIETVNNNISEAFDVNINGVIQCLKAINRNGKKIYLFFASTSHVYKSSLNPISEDQSIIPQNVYGFSKAISEKILLEFQNHTGFIGLCIGRIFSFYHESQKPPFFYPSILVRLKNENLKRPFYLKGANSVRDFSSGDEICDKILKLVNMEYTGTINIASGIGISISDFVRNISNTNLKIDFDKNELVTYLVADVSLFNSL